MLGLGIGVTRASIHSFGNLPDLINMLKSFVTAGVMLPTVALSILADIPSGPLDIVISMLDVRVITSTSVHNSSSGQTDD